jgi:Cellulose binding domain
MSNVRRSLLRGATCAARAARWTLRAASSVATLWVASCAPMHAEVGSDPPADAGWTMDDGASSSADASDATGIRRCDARAGLRLYYRNLRTASSSTDINYIVKVENATGAAIAVSSLEVRYYFTNELTSAATIDVFYTDTCCSNKKTDFNDAIRTAIQAVAPQSTSDSYLSIGFAASVGNLANGDAVQVEIAFHEPGYTRNLAQNNDYSFAATAGGTQTQWNDCPGPQCDVKFTSCALTVHQSGALVWGTPP